MMDDDMDDDQQPLSLTTALDVPMDAPLAALDALTLTPASPPPLAPPAATMRFRSPLPAATHLSESVVYRPGAVVALALLAGPVVCALGGALATLGATGGALPSWLPIALPFALLLWLPALALAWALLTSVRVTPDTLACGRPLGRWRVLPFQAIERVERRGPRLIVRGRRGPPLSFTPRLLQRGAELRRTLLLRLPLSALAPELRAEARLLNGADDDDLDTLDAVDAVGDDDDLTEGQAGDVRGVLTVRARRRWLALAGGAALLGLAGALATLLTLPAPLSLALAGALLGLAGALGGVGLWTAQELFVSEKGLLITYPLLRVQRDVVWAQVRLIEYLPGETALLLHTLPGASGRRGVRTVLCAGPGLLDAQQARRLRRAITRYCLAPVVARLGAARPLVG